MSVRSSLESIFSHLYPAAAEDDLGLSTAADGINAFKPITC